MRDELKAIYESVLEYEIDSNAEPQDFETHENNLVVEHLELLLREVKEVADAQALEDTEAEQ